LYVSHAIGIDLHVTGAECDLIYDMQMVHVHVYSVSLKLY